MMAVCTGRFHHSDSGEESAMDDISRHPVARIDETVTPANLHERAESVAVPNFNYLEQIVEGVIDGLTHRHHPSKGRTAKD
jgi:hypothetical protein